MTATSPVTAGSLRLVAAKSTAIAYAWTSARPRQVRACRAFTTP
jgi:hypothetical protein